MKNIVILVVDSLRTKSMSLFGYSKETDKNLKRIAKENLLFREHFSSSNATAPSLTALFTGKYPINNGIIHHLPYTPQEEIEKLKESTFWFPSYLKEKGYKTLAIDWIGLWLKEGFDYYKEGEEKKSMLKRFLTAHFMKKLLLGLPNWAYKLGKKIIKTRTSPQFPPASETMDLAISKIRETKKPFFLFVHFWDTHFPFPTIKKSKGGNEENIKKLLKSIKNRSQREYFKKRITDINLYSIQDIKDKYDLAIKDTDKQIGRLHDFLKKENLLTDTILVILGDHGESLDEHEIYFSHAGLFDETIHVPLIIHLPNLGAREMNGMVQNIDIVPTILDFLGFDIKEKLDGKSLLPLIKGNEEIRDRVFMYDGLAGDVIGVRTKDKKLIIAKDNRCQLCKANHHSEIEEYDLEKDPKERKNIYSGKSELISYLA